ncbi:MAG: hypothetical protein CK425_00155 [Parachlamydia sp.]|nr:MAG: hypothetical protein CK425_00155 [Parachlamydia sp.]
MNDSQVHPSSYVIPESLHALGDVMPQIFDYLKLKDRAIASLVCKYFKGIAGDWIHKFETRSGIPQIYVKPFLIESLKVFPELAQTDFTLYVTVQEFFKRETRKALARLDVSTQSSLLVTEILKGLEHNKEPVDSFNLFHAISTNNLPLLEALLATLKFKKPPESLIKKYHEDDQTLESTRCNEIIKFTLENGSLEVLKLVVDKISIHRQNLFDVVDLLKEEFNPANLAKLDLMADVADELLLKNNSFRENIYEELDPKTEDPVCLEEESPLKFTFGELLKAIASRDIKVIEALITRVNVVPTHYYCASVLEYTDIQAILNPQL